MHRRALLALCAAAPLAAAHTLARLAARVQPASKRWAEINREPKITLD